MPSPSEADIQKALGNLADGMRRYQWLQANVHRSDVATNREFQKKFNGFYRVRRGAEWQASFFELMEAAKRTGIQFTDALRSINTTTGRIEASFASKLVATLDPSKPVIDKFVLQQFALQLPMYGVANRVERTIVLYHQLCDKYALFMNSPVGSQIRTMFDERYPGANITDLKKIDLVLWQIR